MDINDNQQINTFVKGMNTDVSDSLMDSSQYRYAENVRIATNKDENSGELRLIEGTAFDSDLYKYGTIIAMTSIRDILIAVTEFDGDANRILIKEGNNGAWIVKYESAHGEKFGKYLSLVTRWETDNDVKLYIADGEHELMYINLKDPKVTDILYGIRNISSDVASILSQPIVEIDHSSGIIPPVKVQYAYRLYKNGGAATTISPLSKVITLYKNATEGYSTDIKQSTKSVKITIQKRDNIDIVNLDYMLIYRISYQQVGQLPSVSIIYDGIIRKEYIDHGYDTELISYTDFLSLIKFNIKPTIIESKQDYLFAANIQYPFDDVDDEIPDADVRALSSGDYDNDTLLDYNKLFEDIDNYDWLNWLKPSIENPNSTDSVLNKIGGEGKIISWKFKCRYIYLTDDNKKYTDWNSRTKQPINQITEPLNSLRQGEVYRYGAVFYTAEGKKTSAKWIADIMVPTAKDVFEFGYQSYSSALVYGGSNNTGAASFTDAGYVLKNDDVYRIVTRVSLIGIDFTINASKLPSDFIGVEIVRCKRTQADKINVVQGIAGFPYKLKYHKDGLELDDWIDDGVICAPHLISNDNFIFKSWVDGTYSIPAPGNRWVDRTISGEEGARTGDTFTRRFYKLKAYAESDNTKLVFACPEYSYQPDDIEDILQSKNLSVQKVGDYSTPVNKYNIAVDIFCDSGIRLKLNSSNTNLYQIHSYNSPNNNSMLWWIDDDGNYVYDIRSASVSVVATNDTGETYISPIIETHGFHNLSFNNIYAESKGVARESNAVDILNIAFTKAPDYNTFLLDGKPNYTNSSVNLGSTQYINWSVPLMYYFRLDHILTTYKGDKMDFDTDDDADDIAEEIMAFVTESWPALQPSGSTGQYVLIDLGENSIQKKTAGRSSTTGNTEGTATLHAMRMNIKKKAVVPYGGHDSISLSTYMSNGNLKIISRTSGADNTITVFDGDCYPGIFEFNAQHAWYNPEIITKEFGNLYLGIRQATVYHVPIESDIDLAATYGNLYSRFSTEGNSYYIQDKIASFDGYTQSKEAYLYNTGYGIEADAISFTSDQDSYVQSNKFDCRVHSSELKTNGESIDNWLRFKALNYIDVDTRFGSINNLRLFKDRLLFWQDNAVGLLSVNDRTILNDTNDNAIIVGNGDILSRFDYISTIYGMRPYQYEAEIQSHYSQYWWDENNREILQYSGEGLAPLTKLKGVTNYINQRLNSDHPALAFDPKYNEVLAQVVKTGSRNETLVYNEQSQAFSAIYTFNPLYRATIDDNLYLSTKYRVYINNKQDDKNYSVLFEEPAFPKVRVVINKNNVYTKTFDNFIFGGRMYKGSFIPLVNTPMGNTNGYYIKDKEHMNSPMHHLKLSFTTPLKQSSSIRGDKAITVDEYDFRLAIPRDKSYADTQVNDNGNITTVKQSVEYGNRMRGKTMQCEIASDYNSTDFSLQYTITKFRMSWS